MKVAELEGAALDYWVASAGGADAYYPADSTNPERFNWLRHGEFGSAIQTPKYSTDWAQGGPIIERETIELRPGNAAPNCTVWWARHPHNGWTTKQSGQTPLIATMRAYVASKFGDTVPDEVNS